MFTALEMTQAIYTDEAALTAEQAHAISEAQATLARSARSRANAEQARINAQSLPRVYARFAA